MKTILIIYTNQKLTGILDIAKYQTYSFNTSIDIKVGDLISSKEYSTNMQVIKVIDKALALYNRNTGELSNEYTSTAQGEIRNLEDLIVLKDEDLTVLKEKDIALRKIEKTIVVPERSNSTNLPIFEIEDTIYLMNNDQQNAYNIIKSFIKERLKNKELIGTDSINFNEPLSKKYSGIIPIGMWNNMIGIIGKGGTGKTSLINKIISDVEAEEKLENKYSSIKFKYVAPTHNAVTVLQESLGLDSEEVGSVRTTASLVARNQLQGSKRAELGNPDDELLLLRQDIYKDEITRGKREPISGYDIIIVDESSMISGQDIRDIIFRFEDEHEYQCSCYSPIFIFMGDYRQLPPINTTIDKSFQEGIISATLFSDKYKEKHLELSQIMRSKNEDLHKIFDSIGDQITEQRKDFNLGKPIKLFDFSLFDSVSNKSTNNVLVVKESHIEIMIDNYVDVLINNKYPYEMFWVHYNNTSHLNTQKLFKTIRKCYFEKLKLPIPEDNVIAVNDYVQFKGSLPVKTIVSERYCKGIIKPTARFKVISRGEGQYLLYRLIPLDKFIGIKKNAELIVV